MKTNLFSVFILLILSGKIVNAQKREFIKINEVQSKSLEFKNDIRTYDIYAPKNIIEPMPLVLMFHGGGGNSKEVAYTTNWVDKAKKENFIVVFPNGTRPDSNKSASFGKNGQNWNDGSTRSLSAIVNSIDDVGFIRKLIDTLKTTYKIDTNRIFATGFSNGASMTFRLGAECSDIFAAIAPVSGSLWLENPKLTDSISVLYITGDSDPLNPFNGGNVKIGNRYFGYKKPVEELIMLWTKLLNAEKKEDVFVHEVHKITFKSSNSEVLWLTIKGMGHHWPGGNQTLPKWLVGNPSDAINGTDYIWEFFKNHNKVLN